MYIMIYYFLDRGALLWLAIFGANGLPHQRDSERPCEKLVTLLAFVIDSPGVAKHYQLTCHHWFLDAERDLSQLALMVTEIIYLPSSRNRWICSTAPELSLPHALHWGWTRAREDTCLGSTPISRVEDSVQGLDWIWGPKRLRDREKVY